MINLESKNQKYKFIIYSSILLFIWNAQLDNYRPLNTGFLSIQINSKSWNHISFSLALNSILSYISTLHISSVLLFIQNLMSNKTIDTNGPEEAPIFAKENSDNIKESSKK